MKVFIVALCVLTLLVAVISANSLYIEKLSGDFADKIDRISTDDIEIARAEITVLYKNFKRAEKVISITTSHDDLTSIEEGFAEMMGALETEDMSEVIKIKSRLRSAFLHLGRLSGINIDSII